MKTLEEEMKRKPTTPSRLNILVIFLLFSAAIVTAGYLFYKEQELIIKKQQGEMLSAVADLKVRQIVAWRNERLGDAGVIQQLIPMIALIDRYDRKPSSAENQRAIIEWMKSIADNYGYASLVLLDLRKRVRLATRDEISVMGQEAIALADRALQTRRIVMSDLRWGQVRKTIRLDIFIPLYLAKGRKEEPVGVMILRIDPYHTLYPLIQSWPTPSPTAETLLVRREGDNVLYLNELRHRKDTALNFSLPLATKDLPAAMALAGTQGIAEGIDYRHVPVLTVARPVNGTNMFIVAKVDADEVYAPLRSQAWMVLAVVVAMICFVGAFLGFLWRKREAESFREIVREITERKKTEEALREREAMLSRIFEVAPIGLCIVKNRVFQRANQSWMENLGYSESDLIGQTPRILYESDEEYHRVGKILYADLPARGLTFAQTKHKKKNGETCDVIMRVVPLQSTGNYYGMDLVAVEDITERKRAEEKLRKSEELYTKLVDTIPDFILRLDLAGKILFVNDYALQISGYSREDLEGEHMLMFIAPEDHDRAVQNTALMLENRLGPQAYQLLMKDGRKLPFEVNGDVLRNEDGKPFGIVFICRDVTERKKSEEALYESEGKFRSLVEKSMVGVYLLQDNLFRYVNAKFAEIFGYETEEIIDRLGPQEVIFPDDRPLVEEKLRQRLSGEIQSPHYEFRIKTKYEEVKTVEVFISRTLYQGKPAVIGTLADVTDRLKAAEELRRLSFAIEQAAENILITDPEGVIQYANPSFEKNTGYSRSEAIGQNPRLLKSGMHDAAFYANLWSTIKSGRIWSGRLTNRRKDGKLIHEDSTISPLITSTGKLTGYVALKRDVTETVNLENHLRQTQKMEAIGTLAGGIAHDFNNMLGAMMGYTELIKLKTTDRGIYPFLEQILKACNRSRDLVQQILTFSRQREQEKKPVAVMPIVKEALKLLRSSTPATIEIRQHFTARHDVVIADPTQIHQVLMNLCTNAVHAMRDREGILEVVIGQRELSAPEAAYSPYLKEGSYLLITVKDTGEGINPAIKDKIFDPFFTTKRPGEGTGLGLSVVYGIVKNHGGIISVESEAGEGTVFTVLLPLIDVDEKREGSETVSIPAGNGHILYVDDEEPIASLGKEMLASLGYDVTVCFSSGDALDAFRAHPELFDLVITDMTMPNMTGASLAREILTIRPDLPIILTTGFSERINEEEAKRLGIREFLMKPVSISSLARAVKRIMDPGTP